MAAIAVVVFFASLLAHELGHAIRAQREGMQIDGITLWVFGGVAKFRGSFPSAGAEFRIAIAGPLVSLLLGVLFLAAALLVPFPPAVDGVLFWLGQINLMLLVFNMLPALPLDGGRVFRALVWQWTGDFTRATRIAGAIGKGFGQAMIFGGILLLFLVGALGGIWLAMIGWFLTVAADAESKFATISAALGSMRVSEAMARRPVTVAAEATLSEFAENVFERNRYTAYPVLDGERVAGLVGFRDVAAVPRAQWDRTQVAGVARPLDRVLVLGPDSNLGEAAMELLQSELQRGLVLADGRLVGLLSMTDVSRLIELRRDESR
jgi:Zn-dependent protease/CBS domain-containing protein